MKEKNLNGKAENSKKRIDAWGFVSRSLVVLQIIALLWSFYFIQIQIKDVEANKNSKNVDYSIQLYDKAFDGQNLKIALAIQDDKPILKSNKGKFEEADLDSYLSVLESVSDVFELGLIKGDLVYSNFSDAFMDIDKNKEIREYLKKIRKDDSEYYSGIDKLIVYCRNYKSSKK
jgi:hypothetical protein